MSDRLNAAELARAGDTTAAERMSDRLNAAELARAGDTTAAAHLIVAAALDAVTAHPEETPWTTPSPAAAQAPSPGTATPRSSNARS